MAEDKCTFCNGSLDTTIEGEDVCWICSERPETVCKEHSSREIEPFIALEKTMCYLANCICREIVDQGIDLCSSEWKISRK